jgi:hypothetical protein
MRLNGWQRIGIVLPIAWAIVGGLGTWYLQFLPILKAYQKCESIPLPGLEEFNACWHSVEIQRAALSSYWRWEIVIAALLPIPIAWLVAYGFIGLVR